MADSASSASTNNLNRADAAATTDCNHRRKSGTGSTSSPSSMRLVEPLSLCEMMLLWRDADGGEGWVELRLDIVNTQHHHTHSYSNKTITTNPSQSRQARCVRSSSSAPPPSSRSIDDRHSDRHPSYPHGLRLLACVKWVFSCWLPRPRTRPRRTPSIATTTATTGVPAPAETTPASVESSASATAPSGKPTTLGSEAPAPSIPAGSETATAPPCSLTTATGTPTAPSSSRSSVNKGCGFLLGRDVYFNGGEWCLSVVPVHERISGTRNPEKARREQVREGRREQESKGPLTEQQRKAFGDYVRMMNYFVEGRLYQERR
ncbi:hypothetical protein LTR17_000014 [Elasticomyces elasticus]|nr:hypothetical protein LTR17_000014 [Elasticomyces elasticus]